MQRSPSEIVINAASQIIAAEIRNKHTLGLDYSDLMEAYIALRRCIKRDPATGSRFGAEYCHNILQGKDLG